MVQVHRGRDMVKAQAEIEREASADAPVVLRVPFDVPKEVVANGLVISLCIGIEIPQQRVGESVAGVVGIISIVGEAVGSTIIHRCRLNLAVALGVESNLELV